MTLTDKENLRYVFLSDGNYFKLIRKDPFGFWHIEMGEGATAAKLKDAAFTTIEYARIAVNNYVHNDYGKYAEIVAKQVEKAEPVKYKREKAIYEAGATV